MTTRTEEATFRVDGRALRGHVFRPDHPPEKYLLFVHGLGSDHSGYVERAAAVSRDLGVAALAFDLGGHGESEGRLADLAPADHLSELAAAYDFLLASSPPRTMVEPKVGVCGASYGGYLSALLPGVREVWRMLLRAPALYPDDLFEVPLGQRRKCVAVHSDMVSSAARRFPGRALVVESENDTVIPHEVILQYLQEFQKSEPRTLYGAAHALERPEDKEKFLEWILEWFA
jgi:uncharacterized protein